MSRLSTLAAIVLLAGACSADSSPSATGAPPTTSPSSQDRIVAGDMIGLPNDSADLVIATTLLALIDDSSKFKEFFTPPDFDTIGGFIDASDEVRPLVTASLDGFEARNVTLQSYLGNDTISASRTDLRDLTDALDAWIAGQRIQNDPKVLCLDKLPESSRSYPIEQLFEQSEYTACFTEYLSSDVVTATGQAGDIFRSLVKKVYDETVAG